MAHLYHYKEFLTRVLYTNHIVTIFYSEIGGKASSSHTHDNRYYTGTDADNRFLSLYNQGTIQTNNYNIIYQNGSGKVTSGEFKTTFSVTTGTDTDEYKVHLVHVVNNGSSCGFLTNPSISISGTTATLTAKAFEYSNNTFKVMGNVNVYYGALILFRFR